MFKIKHKGLFGLHTLYFPHFLFWKYTVFAQKHTVSKTNIGLSYFMEILCKTNIQQKVVAKCRKDLVEKSYDTLCRKNIGVWTFFL